MYKFQIRRSAEFEEENARIKGFSNMCTNETTLDFIDNYCNLYKYYFRPVWENILRETSTRYVCNNETIEKILSSITKDAAPNIVVDGTVKSSEGETRRYKIDSRTIKAWYYLYCASAASMTKKAIFYVKQHKEELEDQFDIPDGSSEDIYTAFIAHPAINLKYHSLGIHDGGNIRIISYDDIETTKRSKKRFNVSAGLTAVYLETPQLLYKCGLSDKEIREHAEVLLAHGTMPARIKIYGRPDSFLKIFSNIKSVKVKCVKTESACCMWFEKSEGIFGDAVYAYIGSVEDYVRYILSTIFSSKFMPIHKTDEEGRCAPYLSNPDYIDEDLPQTKVNMAGIDIGFHTMYTVATYNTENGQIEDVHIGDGCAVYDKVGLENVGSLEDEINKAADSLTEYLKARNIYSVAIENHMFAKLRRINRIKVPRFESNGSIEHFKFSVSDEELYYIALTAALIVKLYKAGIKIYAVETYNTSKVCSNCGELTKPKNPAARVFECPYCGAKRDRDENAARNMLNKLYAAEIKRKPIRTVKLNRKYSEAKVFCVGGCYEMELIEKAAV